MKIDINIELPDNATIIIGTNGIKFSATLNVPKKACKIDTSVFNARKTGIIGRTIDIKLSDLTYSRMWYLYRTIIKELMLEARKLKIKLIQSEIREIKQYKLNM